MVQPLSDSLPLGNALAVVQGRECEDRSERHTDDPRQRHGCAHRLSCEEHTAGCDHRDRREDGVFEHREPGHAPSRLAFG